MTKLTGVSKLNASNFQDGESDPRGQAQSPQKGVPAKSISSKGFEMTGCVIPFWNRDNEAKKSQEQNFEFWPLAGEK